MSILASLSVFLGLDKGSNVYQAKLSISFNIISIRFIAGLVFIYFRPLFKTLGSISLTFYHDIQFICLSAEWMDWGWTILYWAWWISWSPFVGMFIARVSRGRTIREFIVGVLLIPTGFTIIWMGFLGNAALFSIIHEHQTTLIQAVQQDSSVALFEF